MPGTRPAVASSRALPDFLQILRAHVGIEHALKIRDKFSLYTRIICTHLVGFNAERRYTRGVRIARKVQARRQGRLIDVIYLPYAVSQRHMSRAGGGLSFLR